MYLLHRKAIVLAKDNTKELYLCVLTYIGYPKKYQSSIQLDEVIKKLETVNNFRVDEILGKYYYKCKKVGMSFLFVTKRAYNFFFFLGLYQSKKAFLSCNVRRFF